MSVMRLHVIRMSVRQLCCALVAQFLIFPAVAAADDPGSPLKQAAARDNQWRATQPGQRVRQVTYEAVEAPDFHERNPQVNRQLRNRVNDLIESIHEAEVELDVTLRHSKLIRAKHDIVRVAIADPSIIEFVAFGPREIEVIGRTSGSTTLSLWLGDGLVRELLTLKVNVTRDTSVEDRRRLEYGELQKMINEMFPNSKVQLVPVADKLIVRGQARDEQEAVQIMSLIRERGDFGPGLGGPFGGAFGSTVSQGTAASPFPDAAQLPQSSVISMLRVPGEKQVMLKVRIAELSRSAARSFGVTFDLDVGDFFASSAMAASGNLFTSGTFDGDSFNLVIDAMSGHGTAKVLAEPNLVVLSGQTASFIAGGQFAVPTVVGVGGAQAASTHFQSYGTQLLFTPTVLDKDRIRLNVTPTFSTLNNATAVNGIPGMDTRTVSTTVELREGQVLAIAGLLQDQQSGSIERVPLLGDIPLLSQIFSSKSTSRSETELIVLVSPELVHPLEPEQAPAILPGMEVTEPDDIDFFLHGRIEGCPDCDHRSTIWPMRRGPYCQHGKRSRQSHRQSVKTEEYYLNGQHGFTK